MKNKIRILIAVIFLTANYLFAQTGTSDKIIKHTGEEFTVKVKEVTSSIIKYSYPGEDVIQNIGKYAVEKIVYGSGREEKISDKILLHNDSDYERVVIMNNKDEALGLVDKGEVIGKTAGISYQTPGSANKASLNRIRKAAVLLGAPFILIDENTATGARGQSIRRGHAYAYK